MLPSIQDAVSAAKAGDLSTACNLLDQCIQKETDPAALFQAALCYRSADRVNDALSLLKTLEDRGQTQPPALLLRADIFCSLDRAPTRLATVQDACRDRARAHAVLGSAWAIQLRRHQRLSHGDSTTH